MKGERSIREKKYALAVQQFEAAVQLMPTNAQVWNYLGVALHHNKQPKEALKAYRQALALDRKLSVVHYNIGCLLLEQIDPAAAIDPLVSYTYLQPRSARGWLKLGTAQLRARKVDAAETNFKKVIELEPRNTEALNDLGVVYSARRRYAEALASFNAAAREDAKYAPALLNAAITSQQLNNPNYTLQKCRQYLALQPRPAQYEGVAALAHKLEIDLLPPKTIVSKPPLTNKTASVETAATTPPVRTNPIVQAAPPKTNTFVASVTNSPMASNKTEVVSALVHPLPTKKAPELEVTRVSDELVVSQDVAPIMPAKPNLIARLNPFGQTEPRKSPAPEALAVPRYSYENPAPPPAGDHTEATRLLAQGVKAHQNGRLTQALPLYERAARLDPSFFEAQYNLGLAVFEGGNTARSLSALERALSIRPDSSDARYNFAIALKQAGYARDAAEQLERLLKATPNDTRAHLSLGNLYAQRLHQPALAREHYTRVLQNEPRHPQAAEIRFWLAANQ